MGSCTMTTCDHVVTLHVGKHTSKSFRDGSKSSITLVSSQETTMSPTQRPASVVFRMRRMKILCGPPWNWLKQVAVQTRIVLALNKVTMNGEVLVSTTFQCLPFVEKEPYCLSTSDHIPLITGHVTVDTRKTIWVDADDGF